MDGELRETGQVILTGRAREGDTVAVVAFDDGRYAIAREGAAAELVWDAGGLEECMTEFARLVGLTPIL